MQAIVLPHTPPEVEGSIRKITPPLKGPLSPIWKPVLENCSLPRKSVVAEPFRLLVFSHIDTLKGVFNLSEAEESTTGLPDPVKARPVESVPGDTSGPMPIVLSVSFES